MSSACRVPARRSSHRAYRLGLGGKGANQAVAARRLGSAVSLIGRVGGDAFGQTVLDELRRFAVDTALIAVDRDGATGMAMIHVAADGENTIAIMAGGNGGLGNAELDQGKAALEAARVLLLQLEVPLATSLAAAAIVRTAGGLAILDPAPAPAGGLSGEVLAAIDILTPNETEAAALTGALPRSADDGIAAARALRQRGIATAIVKLGARGAAFSGPSGEGFQPPFAVATVDSVAAGDCFNGALAHSLAQGVEPGRCGALRRRRRRLVDHPEGRRRRCPLRGRGRAASVGPSRLIAALPGFR